MGSPESLVDGLSTQFVPTHSRSATRSFCRLRGAIPAIFFVNQTTGAACPAEKSGTASRRKSTGRLHLVAAIGLSRAVRFVDPTIDALARDRASLGCRDFVQHDGRVAVVAECVRHHPAGLVAASPNARDQRRPIFVPNGRRFDRSSAGPEPIKWTGIKLSESKQGGTTTNLGRAIQPRSPVYALDPLRSAPERYSSFGRLDESACIHSALPHRHRFIY